MPNYRTEDIRNIALVGHTGCGKTTLIEALLAKAGAIGEAGTIERGNTVTDHDPLEHEYHHSLDSAIASLDYNGMHLNMIDTAGFPDFRGPTLAGMAAAETSAIIINAHNGIELSTRRLMSRAKQRRMCRMIIINKIDQENVDLNALVTEIRQEFGTECLPINLPADNLSTVKDCFFHTEGETDIFSLSEAHEAIIDQVVEVNDALMEKYLEGEELSRQELHNACGSSTSSRARSSSPRACSTRSSRRCARGTWCRSASPRRSPGRASANCSSSAKTWCRIRWKGIPRPS